MGRVRGRLTERNLQSEKIKEDVFETGEAMDSESTEVKALYESMDVADEDDARLIEQTKSAHHGSFMEAVSENLEQPTEQISEAGQEVVSEATEEREKVENAGDLYSRMESITEIGSEHASEGVSHMQESAREYEEIIDMANEIAEEAESKVSMLKSSIDSNW